MDRVWYVAYGSNLYAPRFTCYLEGGQPPGAARCYPGARDHRPAEDVQPLWLPGRVYFAMRSPVWGGGRAYYDRGLPGVAAARGYLVTAGQFADVVAQEMHREPGTDIDFAELVSTGRQKLGEGDYESLLQVGQLAGLPMITFTAPWQLADITPACPSGAYLRLLALGLREAHGWDSRSAAEYLVSLPGAAGSWSTEQVVVLLDEDVPAVNE